MTYPQTAHGAITIPQAVPPKRQLTGGTGPEVNIDTDLSDVGNPLLEGSAPSLDPIAFLPTVTSDEFAAADLPANGVRLSQAGKSSIKNVSNVRSETIAYAKQFLGVPYVWGGTSPRGFDCSGFVQYVTRHYGLRLPRVSYEQAAAGKVTPLSQLKPGDLVGWNEDSTPGADHIAIYLGGGKIIEAPHTGANVRIRSLGKTGFDRSAYGVHIKYPGE